MEKKALVVMDYINEIVHPEGKLSGKGYSAFVEKYNTIENLTNAITMARENDFSIVYVKVGFSEDYNEHPAASPLFGKAKEYKALTLGTWATEFLEQLDVQKNDKIVIKNRVSPFFETDLHHYLQMKNITEVYLAGVATDLVVQSAARDAHDRDYNVRILSDCCAAANEKDHEDSLITMGKIGIVDTYKNLL
jgi:nicotinamidase-related amidase